MMRLCAGAARRAPRRRRGVAPAAAARRARFLARTLHARIYITTPYCNYLSITLRVILFQFL